MLDTLISAQCSILYCTQKGLMCTMIIWICHVHTQQQHTHTLTFYFTHTHTHTHTQSPFGGEDEEELFDSICNSKIPFSRYLDNYTIDFLDKLLQREPVQRLGCMEDRQPIRKHLFFRSIDFGRLERREIPAPYKLNVVSYT